MRVVVTDALVSRVVELENENLIARLSAYAGRPGNPAGVEVRRFGRAVACMAAKIESRFYNSILGVGPETIEELPAILEHYAAHGVSPAFEVVPGRLTEPLGAALAMLLLILVTVALVVYLRAVNAEDEEKRHG